MPNILFAGFLYDNAGDPITTGVDVELFPKTDHSGTPLDTSDTNGSGYWSMSTSTQALCDVKITSGSSIRYIKYDTSAQMLALEVASLRIRNPADTFVYDIVPGAISGADRQLNLPVITGTDTVAVLGLAQTFSAAQTFTSTVTVGVNDTGQDVKFFGATAGSYWLWDESADGVVQVGTLTVGVDDAGHDVKFFGATSGAYMLWDESADDLIIAGAGAISIDATTDATNTTSGSFHTDGGAGIAKKLYVGTDLDVDGTANLDAVDIDGAVQIDATFTSGVDGQGYDTKFFGDTASAYMLWDTSADDLILAGAANLSVDSTTASTSTTTGSIHTDGGLGVALDVYVGDDLFLASSGAIIDFNSGDITLTHSSGYLTFDGGTLLISDGDGLVVGHSALLNVNGFNPKAQILGTGRADGSLSIGVFEAGTSGGQLWLFKSRGTTIGGTKAIVLDDDVLGEIRFIGDDGVDYNSSAAIIKAEVDGTPGSNDMPGRLMFLTTPDGSASSAERWRITNVGSLTSLAASPANAATADGGIIATGGLAFTDVANAWIDDGSQGSGTVTHYIGNQSITTSSDIRIKTNIENWVGSALDFFKNAPRLVTFNWDDPTDTSPFGKNHRGTYRGWLAQETIDWAPWIVNAGAGKDCPQCKAGEQCENTSHSDSTQHPMWHVDYQHMVPMMVEGIREFDARLSRLEALMSVSA
jgi:hypothetical protein